ncbi:MAG TPA: hypothetical protein VNR40_10240 [Steroidobacter sp.]|nr:hypothetical protein [Steroidobacter sp.]
MNKRFRGASIITGCMLVAGASVADTSEVRGEVKSDGTYVEPLPRPVPDPSKLHARSPKKDTHPRSDRAEAKNPLQGRRPQ